MLAGLAGPPVKGLPDGEEYQVVAPSEGKSAPELFIHTFRIYKKIININSFVV